MGESFRAKTRRGRGCRDWRSARRAGRVWFRDRTSSTSSGESDVGSNSAEWVFRLYYCWHWKPFNWCPPTDTLGFQRSIYTLPCADTDMARGYPLGHSSAADVVQRVCTSWQGKRRWLLSTGEAPVLDTCVPCRPVCQSCEMTRILYCSVFA